MDQTAQKVAQVFQQQNNIHLVDMLNPITSENPAGDSLIGSEIYQHIQQARRQDDQSTPRGVWEFDMRHANWDTVYDLASNAISNHSKDLQLAAWMMEAQLMRVGFASIAPSIQLIIELCENYWEDAHPQIDDGDTEHRSNIISWINNKLAIAVKQIPITDRPDTEHQYDWSDWEMALRNAQLMSAHPENKEMEQEPSVESVVLNINQTRIEFYADLYENMELALDSIDQLVGLLDEKLGKDSPSLAVLTGVIEEIAGIAYHQLDQRGFLSSAAQSSQVAEGLDDASLNDGAPVLSQSADHIQDRNQAYLALRGIADYLAHHDPHSPTPYLIYKAIEWGTMNTGQLYQELFVEQQGQLNIFELIGLDATMNPSQ